jgi:hypothetical protein
LGFDSLIALNFFLTILNQLQYNERPSVPVYLIDNKGGSIYCKNYNGYCRFGVELVDIFVVAYEMTMGIKVPTEGDDDYDRDKFEAVRNMGIMFVNHPYASLFLLNSNKKVDWYGQDKFKDNPEYVSQEEAEAMGTVLARGGKIGSLGKKESFSFGLLNYGIVINAKITPILHPNLVEDKDAEWKNVFLEFCPDQGHFY